MGWESMGGRRVTPVCVSVWCCCGNFSIYSGRFASTDVANFATPSRDLVEYKQQQQQWRRAVVVCLYSNAESSAVLGEVHLYAGLFGVPDWR